MKLLSMQIEGFRPFRTPLIIDFDQLTMLIGNNDSGKSSILDILDIAITKNKRPDEKDFYTCEFEEDARKISVIIVFQVESFENEAQEFAIESKVTYRVTYTQNNHIAEYRTLVPEDEVLRCDFTSLKAEPQKDVMRRYDPEALELTSNSRGRAEWFMNYVEGQPKVESWVEVPNNFFQILPKIQRYSAMDYEAPEKLIYQTVHQIFEAVIYDEIEGDPNDRQLRRSLQEIQTEAEERINKNINDLQGYIKKYAPSVVEIRYEPHVDFSRGIQSGDFKVDEGHGQRYLSKSGDGTKRKILMATTDWDRDIALAMQMEGERLPNVIRAYDEPDTNLDYSAQHQLFRAIHDICYGENSNIQAVVSTHSPRMIDRAPATSIRMLKDVRGNIEIEKINTDNDDKDVERFLIEIAREFGITNTLIFYERCFIFVEGETEVNALPLFYRTIYGHSMLEDGIRIINVKGKGAFKEFLKFFRTNRQQLSIFFMDTDCFESHDDKLTEEVLQECGFSEEFCSKRIMLVGRQEFEDLFDNEMYVKVFNMIWPKNEGKWIIQDFENIDHEKKFSDQLEKMIYEFCNNSGNKWSKPELGIVLGQHCSVSEIPQDVKNLFDKSREIAKIFEG